MERDPRRSVAAAAVADGGKQETAFQAAETETCCRGPIRAAAGHDRTPAAAKILPPTDEQQAKGGALLSSTHPHTHARAQTHTTLRDARVRSQRHRPYYSTQEGKKQCKRPQTGAARHGGVHGAAAADGRHGMRFEKGKNFTQS